MGNELTSEQRAELLKRAGVDHTTIAMLEPAGMPPIIEEEEEPIPPDDFVTQDVTERDMLKQILVGAHGDKKAALRACDDTAQAEFNRIKLSKKEAYAQGLDEAGKSDHNRNAWRHAQAIGERLKDQVRAHFREHGGFVKAKIKAS